MMITNSKYIAICMLFIPLATGAVTNTAGPRLIDVLDKTQTGLDGDERSIGYVTYNQVGGNLLIDVHVVKAPSSAAVPCDDLEVQLVTQSPDASSPDWATGGIQEEGLGAGFGHFGFPNIIGTMTLSPGPIAGVAAFIVSTGAGDITGAQGVGLRNYGHINLERCKLRADQVGASRVEWITTRKSR